MTDNDPLPPTHRLHLPDVLKIALQRIRLEALEALQNLRAIEYTGSPISQSRTHCRSFPTPPSNDWFTAHRTTLEDLIRVCFEYYRRLYGVTALQGVIMKLIQVDLPDIPPHPDNITFAETHECTGVMHTAFHLDIRALEMLTVDQLVDQIHEDKLIKRDLHGFVTRVPILCAYFRTPLFHSTQAKYYKMVVEAFDQRPNRAQIPWATTSAIYDVQFSTEAPIVAQIATISDPFA